MLIDRIAWKTSELRVKGSLISNNASIYQEYLDDVSIFIRNVAHRGIIFLSFNMLKLIFKCKNYLSLLNERGSDLPFCIALSNVYKI